MAAKYDDIDVRSAANKRSKCWITGLAALSKNRLIAVDHENKKVKLFANHSKLLHELHVQVRPRDVTVISEDEIAITTIDTNKIMFLKVTDMLTLDRGIDVGCMCYGIAYNKNRLFVTFVDRPRLEIMDLEGNVIKTIQKGGDGKKLFRWPEFVCVSEDGDTIYVSDSQKGTVTSVSPDGAVRSVYKDKGLRQPERICVDNNGTVYVCGYNSTNVHALTTDLKKRDIVLTSEADGMESGPFSTCYCQETNKLFIGMYLVNVVHVYQLS